MRHYIEEFEAFWKAYPRRHGNPKEAARKQWVRLANLGALPPLSVLIEGAKAYAAQLQREKKGEEFVAHARTWLSQRRWEDWAPHAGTPLFAPPPVKVDLPLALARIRDALGAKWWQERFHECDFEDDGAVVRVRTRHAYQVERVATFIDISLANHLPNRTFEVSYQGASRAA